jgi:hypothetical protein
VRFATIPAGSMSDPAFPRTGARGHYESYYLRAVDPAAPRGAWIRHTVLRRPGAAPAGSLWCTVWDAAAGPPVAVKATPALARPAGWLAIGDAHFGPGGARGAVAAGPLAARWELTVEATAPPLRHLARAPLYRAPLPRTKLESPAPAARISGTVVAGDRRLELDGWPGMTGHNWGARHAERWLWLHGIGFAGDPGAWLDLAVGRVAVAGRMTPWAAIGALRVDGARRRIGARATVAALPDTAHVVVGAVDVHVTAPAGQTIAWVYADPPGGAHHAANCSIAALELRLEGRTLRTEHGGVYELGTRELPGGTALAPFPDP